MLRSTNILCLAALLGTASCESAAKHPAITIGAVAGTIGFGTCELSVGDLGTCGIVGGLAAVTLGGITALVTLLADTSAHDDEQAGDLDEEGRPRGSTTEGPPGLPAWMIDGGVPPAPPQQDVRVDIHVDVTVGDAGVPAVSDAM